MAILSGINPSAKFVHHLLLLALMGFYSATCTGQAEVTSVITGRVSDETGSSIPGVVVQLDGIPGGVVTDSEGDYKITTKTSGEVTLRASFLGYKTFEKDITLKTGETVTLNISLTPDLKSLNEVVVTAKSRVSEIEAMAFNVEVLDAANLADASVSTGEALNRISGVRVRQSGGMGSRMNLAINGFGGNQVKVFIDGVPMENFGSSFQLNNIPVGMTKRVEVYKGVVPVHLGADALGGAVNIVTDTWKKSHLNLSYSYGSFNTHQSSLTAVHVGKNGFVAQIRAFQNYSDNNYKVKTDVADLHTGKLYKDQWVERFHDTYHNETVMVNAGVVDKKWADKLLVGLTMGQNYNEIQTGARQLSVFGSWYTKGDILMPTLKYSKRNFLTKNLSIDVTANYNFGEEMVVDTVNRRYNWLGEYIEYPQAGGESRYQLYRYRNNSAIATANLNYKIGEYQSVALSSVYTHFDRIGNNLLDPDNEIYEHPRKTQKNVLGASYNYTSSTWSTSVFVKNYLQSNSFAQSYNPTGIYGDVAYRHKQNNYCFFGYGVTWSFFITENLQAKTSYEKSYRLPEATELFGNLTTLEGNIDLKPEHSYNANWGLAYYSRLAAQHRLSAGVNVFYRNARDFIRPVLNKNQTMQVLDNLYNVTSLGVSAEAHYFYAEAFAVGGNITYQNLRNNTRYVADQTVESIVYRDRLPNVPYLFGNVDASYSFKNPLQKKHQVRLSYDLMYVHAFYLYWPSLGQDKFGIPTQIAHNLNLGYTLGKKDNIEITLSCRNITDNLLYDNFSLQKPGRSFTGRISYTL